MSENVTLTIDGIEVSVPKGTLVIRAAEQLGIEIPRFCDHPLLAPVGACRQCLVDVEGQRKPLASCTATCTDGMVVKTQLTSPVAKKAQEGIMEFLLLNHPLDCPMCDKGGECPLQNQAMSSGRPDTRFKEEKRTYRKHLPISSQVLLDRERCVLCARCTRFSDQIAGDPFIELMERSSLEQVGIYEDEPFESYFSGNTVQICPVGALTGTQYRFRARPFDLVSSPSMCEHCSAGCAQRTDHRRNKVLRRLAGDDPQVNEEWNCDKGRWAFDYVNTENRVLAPQVRGSDGELHEASWPDALRAAAKGLVNAKQGGGVGVLTGGRLTIEDAYAYSKFARLALDTNNIDFRSRPHSDEETAFLAHAVAGIHPAGGATTFADIEAAPVVLVAGLEVEEENPIIFLRLRKAHRASGQKSYVLAPYASAGTKKIGAELVQTVPGGEAKTLSNYADGGDMAETLRAPGSVILVGERLATVPGALTAVARLATVTGAKLAWVPRRAGDRGAVDAGALPTILPGGGSVTSEADRAALAAYWDVDSVPAEPGRSANDMFVAAKTGQLTGLLIAGVDPADLADPASAEAALHEASFIVSIEQRHTAVTRRANVVLPIATVSEKGGSYLNWEGRLRTFDASLDSSLMSDFEVLEALASALGVDLGFSDLRTVRAELAGVPTPAERPAAPLTSATEPDSDLAEGEVLLATWRHLLDSGTLQDNNQYLAGTARTPVIRLSATTAAAIGANDGDAVTVSSGTGGITLPLQITDMTDKVVWLPTNSPGSGVNRTLGAIAGERVSIATYHGGTK